MAALAILNQKVMLAMDNASYVVTRVRHDGTSAGTFSVDQSGSAVAVFALEGQTAPTGSIASSGDTNFLKTVTLDGVSGLCDVLTRHQGAIASVKA
jgi:hypothetical protein